MRHINSFRSAAFLLAFAVAATPALAQRRDRGAGATSHAGGQSQNDVHGGNGGQHQDNRAQQPPAAAPRAEAPRAQAPPQRQAPRADQRDQSRGQAVPRVAPRVDNRGQFNNRAQFDNRGRFDNRGGRIVTGQPYYSRPYYSRPYYTFRPRLSLGFGLWLGYPVTYPYAVYGYPYPPTYEYPYYPGDAYPDANVSVAPSVNASSGGVSFDISPATATIFVDGNYVGVVSDFGPNMAPLGLTPGRHHVEIRERDYETMAVDVDIVAGQVVPFQGNMQPF